jgi:acyl-CoA thioester hydrolase
MSEAIPTPYHGYSEVKPTWLDANGHMNIAHYASAFDDGSEPMFAALGLGWDYTRAGVGTMFVLSSSMDFRRELLAGDALAMTTQLLAYDRRRIHIYQELFHRQQGYLAAQAEFVFAHVSLANRGISEIPAAMLECVAQVHAAHAALPRPAFIGRVLGLDWKPGRP